MEKGTKKVNIKLDLDVPAYAKPEEIARYIESFAGKLNPEEKANVKKIDEVHVRFTEKGKIDLGNKSTGYESKIWEKATCKVALDKEDLVSNPVIDKIKIGLKQEK